MKRVFNMFQVKLIDIDNNGQCIDATGAFDTLAEVEQETCILIEKMISKPSVELIHDGDLLYEVFAGGHNIGTVYIKSI